MNKVSVCVAAIICLAGSVFAERLSIVEITDMFGTTEFEIMNAEEFAAIQKEIKEETAILPAMIAASKQEWASLKDAKTAFPGARIKPRTAKKLQPEFNDRAKAQLRKEKLEEREMDRIAKETEKNEKELKKYKDEAKRDAFLEKEKDRKNQLDFAIRLVSKKMGEKLGRPVPTLGFAATTDDLGAKVDAKKAEKKDAEKKDAGKKDAEKADKKEAKK